MDKCKFTPQLLEKQDKNGNFVKEWAKKHDEHHIFCTLCIKRISVVRGFDGIEQHGKGKGHKEKCSQMLAKNQL